MRLGLELVPRPLWRRSAYSLLPRREWEAIRREVLEEAGGRCVTCGEQPEKGLTCHEVWQYDEDEHGATLTAFECVCRLCSLVHHIGFASVGIGPRAEREARERLAMVNGISRDEADRLIEDAFAVWSQRSTTGWQQRVLPDLAAKYPALVTVFGSTPG